MLELRFIGLRDWAENLAQDVVTYPGVISVPLGDITKGELPDLGLVAKEVKDGPSYFWGVHSQTRDTRRNINNVKFA